MQGKCESKQGGFARNKAKEMIEWVVAGEDEEEAVRGKWNGKDEETVFPTDPPVARSGNGKLSMRDFKAWPAKR